MNIRYHVELSEAERCELTALVGRGKPLRLQDQTSPDSARCGRQSGLSDEDIASCCCGCRRLDRLAGPSGASLKVNLEAALNEEPRAGADRKLTSNEEALLIATACSSLPEGRARWTLELLAGAMVKLTDHASLSRENCPPTLGREPSQALAEGHVVHPRMSTPSTSPACV